MRIATLTAPQRRVFEAVTAAATALDEQLAELERVSFTEGLYSATVVAVRDALIAEARRTDPRAPVVSAARRCSCCGQESTGGESAIWHVPGCRFDTGLIVSVLRPLTWPLVGGSRRAS